MQEDTRSKNRKLEKAKVGGWGLKNGVINGPGAPDVSFQIMCMWNDMPK